MAARQFPQLSYGRLPGLKLLLRQPLQCNENLVEDPIIVTHIQAVRPW